MKSQLDAQLIVAIIMEVLNLGSLDAVIHPCELTISALAAGLCLPMLDPVGLANHIEAHRSEIDSITRALLRIYSSDQWLRTEKIFAHLNLGNIHMEEPDWVVLETPLLITSKAFPRAGRS